MRAPKWANLCLGFNTPSLDACKKETSGDVPRRDEMESVGQDQKRLQRIDRTRWVWMWRLLLVKWERGCGDEDAFRV